MSRLVIEFPEFDESLLVSLYATFKSLARTRNELLKLRREAKSSANDELFLAARRLRERDQAEFAQYSAQEIILARAVEANLRNAAGRRLVHIVQLPPDKISTSPPRAAALVSDMPAAGLSSHEINNNKQPQRRRRHHHHHRSSSRDLVVDDDSDGSSDHSDEMQPRRPQPLPAQSSVVRADLPDNARKQSLPLTSRPSSTAVATDTDAASLNYSSTPVGLTNPIGENNCFLNVCIQSLYNLPSFRAALADASSRKHRCPPDCIICGLQSIFVQFAFGDSPQPVHRHVEHALRTGSLSGLSELPRSLLESFSGGGTVSENRAAAVPPTVVRNALAALYAPQGRFQLNKNDDAAEALDAILNEVHACTADADAATSINCCVAHSEFGMLVQEQSECGKCRAKSATATFMQFVHYVSASALRGAAHDVPDLKFEEILRQLACTSQQRCEPCNTLNFIEPSLLSRPRVLTLGFIWDSNNCASEDIGATLRVVTTTLDATAAFGGSKSQRYELRAMLAYYGLHYVAFARNPATNEWAMFDDARVRVLGARFSTVVTTVERARLQPLLLFYEQQSSK
jgi:hypothetical protein